MRHSPGLGGAVLTSAEGNENNLTNIIRLSINIRVISLEIIFSQNYAMEMIFERSIRNLTCEISLRIYTELI